MNSSATKPWRPVQCSVMSDLRPYLLGRMEEMRRQDPSYWGTMREAFISEFGKPNTIEESLQDEDRQDWWLHQFGCWRIDRLKRREITSNKKTGSTARR